MGTEIDVTRRPKDPGPAGWASILPASEDHPVLESALAADWLVIGAGFAGLAAARRLAQLHPGDRIVVLEARRVAEGPAGRNSGFMIDLPHDLTSDDYGGDTSHDLAQIAGNRAAIAFMREAVKDLGLPDEAFRPEGKINAAASAAGHAHNEAFARHLAELGEPCEWRDAADMKALTGIDYYQSGLFTPGAAMLQPALLVRGLARGMVSNRVQIFEHSPVTSLTQAGDWVATTPQGRATAPKVILAVNGHAQAFGFFPRQLMHVFTYASMTRALTPEEVIRLGGARRWGVTPADPVGSTVRRISDSGGDRIVVRNRFTYNPSLESSDAQLARVARDHDRAFAARFPMLKGVSMQNRWGGRLCLTRNGVAAFGELEPGLFSACCQNGLGTAKGTLAGMLAAEHASGRSSDLLEMMLNEAAPQRLPPEPVARIGASSVLKWKEWRAGREL